MGKTVRVKTWEQFKELAVEKKPKNIVYVNTQGINGKHLTGLELILPVEDTQYKLIDSAKGNKMRKTGIPLSTDKKGNRFIKDEDLKSFLKTQLQREDLKVFSYWTI